MAAMCLRASVVFAMALVLLPSRAVEQVTKGEEYFEWRPQKVDKQEEHQEQAPKILEQPEAKLQIENAMNAMKLLNLGESDSKLTEVKASTFLTEVLKQLQHLGVSNEVLQSTYQRAFPGFADNAPKTQGLEGSATKTQSKGLPKCSGKCDVRARSMTGEGYTVKCDDNGSDPMQNGACTCFNGVYRKRYKQKPNQLIPSK